MVARIEHKLKLVLHTKRMMHHTLAYGLAIAQEPVAVLLDRQRASQLVGQVNRRRVELVVELRHDGALLEVLLVAFI